MKDIFCNFLFTIICILLFIYGFFPITQNDDGLIISIPEEIDTVDLKANSVYIPHYERVVLLVIDALRYDFVNENTMPFTVTKANEKGCILDVKVESPTVTLPRIKSLTTGGVPQFIDVILNFGNADSLKESLLHSLKKNNKSVVFYGDNTWLKLFKDIFIRHEGTTSFFVNDFSEVDTNVTRNLMVELQQHDWNMLILHYLGLDHIGHVYGPQSSLIPQKLSEMDNVIKLIYNTLIEKKSKTLILVTGDHGMKDSGGHGGSSFSETHVPLVMLGTNCLKDSISQTDIPANLAVLLGIHIPSTSIGLVRKGMLNNLSTQEYLFAVRYNTIVLLFKRNVCHDHFELASKYHVLYMKSSDDILAEKAQELYENCSKIIHEAIIKSSTQQNIKIMLISTVNLAYIFFASLTRFIQKEKSSRVYVFVFIFPNILYLSFTTLNVFFGELFFFTAMFLLIINEVVYSLPKLAYSIFSNKFNEMFLIIMTILHPFTLFSSSFIEEEHLYWYFTFTSVIFLSILNAKYIISTDLYKMISTIILIRFARTLNQTGDKWSYLPDFSDWLLEKEHHMHLLIFLIGSVISILFLKVVSLNMKFSTLCNICVYLFIISSHILEQEKIVLQRITWCFIFFQLFLCFFGYFNILDIWISVCMLLLKPCNVFLITVCIISSKFFINVNKKAESLVLLHIFLGNTLFFMQGHSNSLASVDVSVGYIGLNSYKPVIVIAQILLHTYSFIILSHLLLLKHWSVNANTLWSILFLSRLSVVVVFFIVALIQRHHLFVWSVFAPKLLIESCHSVALFIEFILYSSICSITTWKKNLEVNNINMIN